MEPDRKREMPEPTAVPLPALEAQPITNPIITPAPEKKPAETIDVPENIKRLLTISFTVLAALLYGAILGGAVIKSLLDSSAAFSAGALRATQILSGLVGTVVTAGFARLKRSNVSIKPQHDENALLPAWFVQSKFLGLADMLGLNLRGIVGKGDIASLEDEPVRVSKINTATWVAAVYFVIYFLVGAGAFVLTVLRSNVPEIISNSAWVWLGTLISSSYTFFALGEDPAAV